MEVAFLISLRYLIHSLKLNLNGRITGSTRICLMLLMLLSLVSKHWGSFGSIDSGSFVTMPLAATPFQVVVNDMASSDNSLCMSTLNYATGKFKVTGVRNDLDKTQLWGHWIAVCN